MPRLAAAVPYEMVFDEKQCEHYDSPSALEHLFAEDWGESIRHDYVVWLNEMLKGLYDAFSDTKSKLPVLFEYSTEVVSIKASMYYDVTINRVAIVLIEIIVRPCFIGHGMLTLVVYQLLQIAWRRSDVGRVVVERCVPTTALALKRKFGESVCLLEGDFRYDYAFCDLEATRDEISAETLGIDGKIESETAGLLTLNANEFPSAYDLSDQAYVDQSFGPAVATSSFLNAAVPKSMVFDSGQAYLYRTPEKLERTFASMFGRDIAVDYVAKLNAMLKKLYDTFTDDDIDNVKIFNHWTDVVTFGADVVPDRYPATVSTMNLTRIAVRPCFGGQNMLTIIVYQLLLLALKRGDIGKVVIGTCVPATVSALKRKFGDCVVFTNVEVEGSVTCCDGEFQNLETLRGRITAEYLGIGGKISCETDGLLTLNADGFPAPANLSNQAYVDSIFKTHPAPLVAMQNRTDALAKIDAEIRQCERCLGSFFIKK